MFFLICFFSKRCRNTIIESLLHNLKNSKQRPEIQTLNIIDMKKVLFLICCSLLLISCETEKIVEIEKEIEIEVEKQYKWKSHPDFKYQEMVQMNSYANDDYLFFQGLKSFGSFVPDSLAHPQNPFGGPGVLYYNWYNQPNDEKLPMCADYLISYDPLNGKVAFNPTMNPVNVGTSVSFEMKAIDKTFSDFSMNHFSSGECMKINKQNQALIPYMAYDGPYKVLKMAWVDIKVEQSNAVYLDTIETKIIDIPDEWQNNLVALESIGDYFFITTDSKVYRIDNFGNIASVLDNRLFNIIESSGKLYGIAAGHIYISSDEGLTWEKGYAIQAELIWLSYTAFDDRIIAYRNAQLWEIVVNEKELIAKELDDDALVGISITSVSKFDEKVYLSTLGGVYYKSLDEFFDYKIETD